MTCLICADTFDDPYPGVPCACGCMLTQRQVDEDHLDTAALRAWWAAGGRYCDECEERLTPEEHTLEELACCENCEIGRAEHAAESAFESHWGGGGSDETQRMIDAQQVKR